MKDPVKFFSSNQSFEIELIKAKLGENNIESYILNKQDSAYVVIGEVEIYVERDDIERAKVILNDSLNHPES